MNIYFVSFFSISWTFLALTAFIALVLGNAFLEMIAENIILISGVLWLSVILFIWAIWKNKRQSAEKKLKVLLYPLLQIPTYAAMIQVLMYCIDRPGVFYWVLTVFLTGPVVLFVLAALNCGIAWGMMQFYKKAVISKWVAILLGGGAAVIETGFIWNIDNVNW